MNILEHSLFYCFSVECLLPNLWRKRMLSMRTLACLLSRLLAHHTPGLEPWKWNPWHATRQIRKGPSSLWISRNITLNIPRKKNKSEILNDRQNAMMANCWPSTVTTPVPAQDLTLHEEQESIRTSSGILLRMLDWTKGCSRICHDQQKKVLASPLPFSIYSTETEEYENWTLASSSLNVHRSSSVFVHDMI